MNLSFKEKVTLKEVLKKIHGTDIEKLLKEYNVI
jgi:oleate hydratase